jgi:hypothetical protein
VPYYPYYQTSDYGDQQFPSEMVAPELLPDVYNADPFAAGLAGWDIYTPYYDSYPVEFAYTPPDAPQRAAVVHPDPERPSSYSIILPRPARKALYEFAETAVPVAPVSPVSG